MWSGWQQGRIMYKIDPLLWSWHKKITGPLLMNNAIEVIPQHCVLNIQGSYYS